MKTIRLLLLLPTLLVVTVLYAGVGKEVVEELWKRFGKGAAGETTEQLARNLDRLATKYGDDCLPLLRKGGHDAFRALEEVGEAGGTKLVRLFKDKGDDAWPIIRTASKRKLFLAHGDEAAEALIKHPGIADDLIAEVGPQTAATLGKLGKREAQLLHKMHKGGDLRKILEAAPDAATKQGFWKALSTHGDAALNYVWKNKGSLAVAAVLVAFVTNPGEVLSGTGDVLSTLLGPILTWLAPIIAVIVAIWLVLKFRKSAKRKASADT